MAVKTCPNGHEFTKSSDCPTCPVCEAARAPSAGLLVGLGAPARRALEREAIDTLAKLAERSERELLALHGLGPSAIPKLKERLAAAGLSLRRDRVG